MQTGVTELTASAISASTGHQRRVRSGKCERKPRMAGASSVDPTIRPEGTDAIEGRTMDFLDDTGTPYAHAGSVTSKQTLGP